jgi:hypothetical protein
MGFFEDDRVRQKNLAHELGYNLFINLINEGLKPEQVESYILTVDPAANHPNRNDIYRAVVGIVRRSVQGEGDSI